MNQNEIKVSKVFVKAFKWAMQLGMEIEFFVSFIDHMNKGYSIVESISHANREWDLWYMSEEKKMNRVPIKYRSLAVELGYVMALGFISENKIKWFVCIVAIAVLICLLL